MMQPAGQPQPGQGEAPATQPLNAAHPADSPLEMPRKGTPLHMMSAKQKLGYAVKNGYLPRHLAEEIVGTKTPIAALNDPRLSGLSTAMMMGDTHWRPRGTGTGQTMFGRTEPAQASQAKPGEVRWPGTA